MASRSANADEKQEGDNATTLKKRENRAQGEGVVKEEREGEREEECAPRKVPDREKRERGPRRSAKKTFLEWNAGRSVDGRNRNRDSCARIKIGPYLSTCKPYIYIYILARPSTEMEVKLGSFFEIFPVHIETQTIVLTRIEKRIR